MTQQRAAEGEGAAHRGQEWRVADFSPSYRLIIAPFFLQNQDLRPPTLSSFHLLRVCLPEWLTRQTNERDRRRITTTEKMDTNGEIGGWVTDWAKATQGGGEWLPGEREGHLEGPPTSPPPLTNNPHLPHFYNIPWACTHHSYSCSLCLSSHTELQQAWRNLWLNVNSQPGLLVTLIRSESAAAACGWL